MKYDLSKLSKENLIDIIERYNMFNEIIKCTKDFQDFKKDKYYQFCFTEWDDEVEIDGFIYNVNDVLEYFDW